MRVIGAFAKNAAWNRLARRSAHLAGMLAAASFVVTVPRVALAGGYGIALSNSVVERYYPDSTTKLYPFRPANLNPNDINFQDCEDNIHMVFDLLESGSGTPDVLEVWAGTTDCTQPTARAGAEPPFCWQVAPPQPFIANAVVDIYARSLTGYLGSDLTAVPANGQPVAASQPESACRTQTSSGQLPFKIYFMLLPKTADATPDAYYVFSENAALLGPSAPTDVLVADANSSLIVDWTPPVDPTVQGFDVYVADQSASATTGDAAAPDDASSSGTCGSGVFVDTLTQNVPSSGGATVAVGISEVSTAKYGAGDVGDSTTSNYAVTALPGGSALIPGHRYAVAVAAYDEDGNVGLLGNVGCETAVADSGGGAGATGSGGCALGLIGTPARGSALGPAIGAMFLGFARRRRAKSQRSEAG